MLWTLQRYIFFELLKTFALAAIAMTGVVAMGGGVLNVVEMSNVTTGQLLRIMAIVFPVAMTVAVPVASLYSAAIVYGRLSADNELMACSVSGVNVQRLALSAVVLSVLASAAAFLSLNFIIPDRIRHLDQILRSDVAHIVRSQLQAPRRLPLPGKRNEQFRIYGQPTDLHDPSLPDSTQMLRVDRAAFVRMQNDRYLTYGTAEYVFLRFDGLDGQPTVQPEFRGLLMVNCDENQISSFDHQTFPRIDVPLKFALKTKWLDLMELFHYRRDVATMPLMVDRLERLRAQLARDRFYRTLAEDFATPDATGQPDCTLTFGPYTVQATSLTPDLHDGKPLFDGAKVTLQTNEGPRIVQGPNATVEVGDDPGRADYGQAYIEVTGGVRVIDPGETEPAAQARESMQSVPIPEPVLEYVLGIPDNALLDPGFPIHAGTGFERLRRDVMESARALSREIDSEIHSRIAFTISVLVLTLLAAVLGIHYRGSHVLTAFGVSFVPALVLIILVITGRQLAQNEGTVLAGLATIWVSVTCTCFLDWWILARVLRR